MGDYYYGRSVEDREAQSFLVCVSGGGERISTEERVRGPREDSGRSAARPPRVDVLDALSGARQRRRAGQDGRLLSCRPRASIPSSTSPSPKSESSPRSDSIRQLSRVAYWTRSAAQDNVDALVKMGDYYYAGLGTEDGVPHGRSGGPGRSVEDREAQSFLVCVSGGGERISTEEPPRVDVLDALSGARQRRRAGQDGRLLLCRSRNGGRAAERPEWRSWAERRGSGGAIVSCLCKRGRRKNG
jgi:putative hemolysin